MEAELLARWCRGEPWAVRLLLDLGFITQVWDDAVDGDKVLTREAVDGAFIRALTVLPRNPFWLRHQADLLPLLEAWIVDWQTATTIEQGQAMDPTLMRVAWLIRDSSAAIIIKCAGIIGGWEWAQEVALEIRAHLHDEPFDDYARGIARRQPVSVQGVAVGRGDACVARTEVGHG
ncbi:MAG TPA: hypothetical protein VHN38_07485 [Immundisolibacter sp.]|nr:hypothetical protein [Immundisolibacter sp.]